MIKPPLTTLMAGFLLLAGCTVGPKFSRARRTYGNPILGGILGFLRIVKRNLKRHRTQFFVTETRRIGPNKPAATG
jgi:hypothetical protein